MCPNHSLYVQRPYARSTVSFPAIFCVFVIYFVLLYIVRGPPNERTRHFGKYMKMALQAYLKTSGESPKKKRQKRENPVGNNLYRNYQSKTPERPHRPPPPNITPGSKRKIQSENHTELESPGKLKMKAISVIESTLQISRPDHPLSPRPGSVSPDPSGNPEASLSQSTTTTS